MEALDIVRMIAPEFDSLIDEEINNWIELVSPQISKDKFGSLYNQALAYLACHKMKMAGKGENAAGEMGSIANGFSISSISDGGTSISFASAGMNNLTTNAEYGLTVYGTQYLQLRKQCIVPITIAGGRI